MSDLCRITVIGPSRRADLAVPTAIPVATLLPVLLAHTSDSTPERQHADGWILQRLGGVPCDPNGTAESLDWLHGEELHLRPAVDPLPELDYDDLADGIAAAVNDRRDRWQPSYRRQLFLVLAVALIVVIGAVIAGARASGVRVCASTGLTLVLILVTVLAARRLADRTAALLAGLVACGFGALAAAAPDQLIGWPPDHAGVVRALAAAGTVAAVLIVVHLVWERGIPIAAFLIVLLTAVLSTPLIWMLGWTGLDPAGVAGLSVTGLLALVVVAPKLVLRTARLRGPQLPRTGEELQYDIQPDPAQLVRTRAGHADMQLTAILAAVALLMPPLLFVLARDPGWVGPTAAATVSGALLLRARASLGLWQRLSLVAAGGTGWVILVLAVAGALTDAGRVVLLGGLLLVLVALVLAVLRPWPRRLLPIWEFTATILDVVTGCVVPLMALYLLGVFAWARGLFG
jgi:type VII secretion integral membrane protein EccD